MIKTTINQNELIIEIEGWIEKEAGQSRKKYFTGKFVVGRGQAD